MSLILWDFGVLQPNGDIQTLTKDTLAETETASVILRVELSPGGVSTLQ